MKFRHPVIMVCGLLIAILLGVMRIDRSLYMSYLEQKTIAMISARGLRTSFKGFSAGLSGLRADGLSLFYPAAFLGLDAENVEVRPSLLSLLAGSPDASFRFQTCEGSVEGQARYDRGSKQLALSTSLKSINLEAHQQLNGLGIEDGTLNASTERLLIGPGRGLTGQIAFQLKGFNRPRGGNLPIKFLKLPMPLSVPAITNLDLSAELSFAGNNISFSKLESRSQIGNFYGGGMLGLTQDGSPSSLSAEISAHLNDDGYALLKTLSQLARHKGENPLNKALYADQRNWLIKLRGLNPPELDMSPID